MSIANDFDDLDRELLDIFLGEGQDLLEDCDSMLIRLREAPDRMEEIVGLQRALHTIKGGARMTGLIAVGDLSHSIESFLGAVVARKVILDEPRINLLGDSMDELRHMMELARRGTIPNPPQFLINTLEEQANTKEGEEAPAVSSLAAHSSGQTQQTEFQPQAQVLSQVVSALGSAGDTQIQGAKSISTNDVVEQEPLAIEVLLEQENEKFPMTAVELPETLTNPANFRWRKPGVLPDQPIASPDLPGVDPTTANQIPEKDNYQAILPAAAVVRRGPSLIPEQYKPGPMPEQLTDHTPARKQAANNEQVRIQAEALDLLVHRSNEMAIYRSRLEQQLSALRAVVTELGRTNMRMRDQLRRLDGETEAQIVARYQREKTSHDPAFDPLELDRFSTLQQLTRALAESSDDFNGLHETLEALSRQYDQLIGQQGRVSSDLQEGLLRARLMPFDKLTPRLARIVRQAAGDVGKKVRLDMDQAHGELDRNILDRIASPLEHMIRNSIAHGIEDPRTRATNGKPVEGTIAISMRNEGAEIVIEVSDDGAGLNREAIRKRAIGRGLIKETDTLTDRALDDLIFAPGFSTSESINQLAGRGVGMDVVRSEVRQLGGSVEINSVWGKGVKFVLRIPQKMAVAQAVHVRAGESIFAVPSSSILGIGRADSSQTIYIHDGVNYPIISLRVLAGIKEPENTSRSADDQSALLLVRSGDLAVAVRVDQVLGNEEIVVKQVGTHIAEVPGIYGATIDQSGRVVIILDLAPMVRQFMTKPRKPKPATAVNLSKVPTVLVVDDSITMRKVTGRVLERHKFDVKTARDGLDALEVMEEGVPDLMLLDIEMPRMDGYELATRMRADDRYKNVPIIMITSRTGEKHRQKAMDIGVQKYLGKPYQEADLLRNIHEILGLPVYEDIDEQEDPL